MITVSGSEDLRSVLKQAQPCDEIVLAPGIYGPLKIPKRLSGKPGNPTVIRAERSRSVELVGTSDDHAMYLEDKSSDIVVSGFVMTRGGHNTEHNYDRSGFVADSAVRVVVDDCWVHHNLQMGIGLYKSTNCIVSGCLIESNGDDFQFDHGLYVYGKFATVRNCTIRNNTGYGIHAYPDATGFRIFDNEVYDNPHGALILSCPNDLCGGANAVFRTTLSQTKANGYSPLQIWRGYREAVVACRLIGCGQPLVTELYGTKDTYSTM
jgi:parallel beta-helix repeat protein